MEENSTNEKKFKPIIDDDGKMIGYNNKVGLEVQANDFEGVEEYDEKAFAERNFCFFSWRNIKILNLSPNVTTIPKYAFKNCKHLKYIHIPKEINSIDEYAFFGCKKLQKVCFEEGSNVTIINNSVFSGCISLKEINLPNNIQTINDYAFKDCKKLRNINIPKNVQTLGVGLFSGCEHLESVIFEKDSKITIIPENCFENCSHLQTFQITKNVNYIQKEAFKGCKILSIINCSNITQRVKFGKNCFKNCSKLNSFNIIFDDNYPVDKIYSLKAEYFFNHDITNNNENEELKQTKKIIKEKNIKNNSFDLPGIKDIIIINNIIKSLLDCFDKHIKKHIFELGRQWVFIVDQQKYPTLKQKIYSNFLLLSNKGDYDSIFKTALEVNPTNQPSTGIYMKHPQEDTYIMYSINLNKEIFQQKYEELFYKFLGSYSYDVDFKSKVIESREKISSKKNEANSDANINNTANISANAKTEKSNGDLQTEFVNIAKRSKSKRDKPPSFVYHGIWEKYWNKQGIATWLNSGSQEEYHETIIIGEIISKQTNFNFDLGVQFECVYNELGKGEGNFKREHFDFIEKLNHIQLKMSVKFNPNKPSLPEHLYYNITSINDPIPRPNDTNLICDIFKKCRFINLIGMGGSGKSILAYLFAIESQKNPNYNKFDNIAYSTINDTFVKDIFIGNLNPFQSYCNVGCENDADIINKLLEKLNVYSGRNLWIIDINENADDVSIYDAFQSIQNNLSKDWHVLFVSRGNIYPKQGSFFNFDKNNISNLGLQANKLIILDTYNLLTNADLLDKIFINNLEINSKEKFDYYIYKKTLTEKNRIELFGILDNLIIVVKHLAMYLSNEGTPNMDFKTLKQKLSIIKSSTTNNVKRFENGEERDYGTVYAFLSELLKFSKLDDIANLGARERNKCYLKEVARHFMLWPSSSYYSIETIFSLIKGNILSDEIILSDTLVHLSSQNVINVINENRILKYSMHGLIAEAFREQIFNENNKYYVQDDKYRDFSNYLDNIINVEEPKYQINSLYGNKEYDTKNDYFLTTFLKIGECVEYSLTFIGNDNKETNLILPCNILDNCEKYFKSEKYETLLNKFYFFQQNEFRPQAANIVLYSSISEKWYKLKLIEKYYPNLTLKEKQNILCNYNRISSHQIYIDYVNKHPQISKYDYVEENGTFIWKRNDKKLEVDIAEKNLSIIENILNNMIEKKDGKFIMGYFYGNFNNEKPEHYVSLKTFFINKYTVTESDWNAVMNPKESVELSKYPKVGVSWYDCMDFIIALNEITGLQFRLPTEAEWEYACKENYKDIKNLQKEHILQDYAWYNKNSGLKVHEVGTTTKGKDLPIQDLLGNVWEWCADWYDKDYYQYCNKDNNITDNPTGPSEGSGRVDRGGSWNNFAEYCRVSNRFLNSPDCRSNGVGFRLAL
ncbi:MAG: leucine-rich repeat protein [Bacteroidales bacterium]|nr:leucine-rich repeat protein [Bacteroidales bacterium]